MTGKLFPLVLFPMLSRTRGLGGRGTEGKAIREETRLEEAYVFLQEWDQRRRRSRRKHERQRCCEEPCLLCADRRCQSRTPPQRRQITSSSMNGKRRLCFSAELKIQSSQRKTVDVAPPSGQPPEPGFLTCASTCRFAVIQISSIPIPCAGLHSRFRLLDFSAAFQSFKPNLLVRQRSQPLHAVDQFTAKL